MPFCVIIPVPTQRRRHHAKNLRKGSWEPELSHQLYSSEILHSEGPFKVASFEHFGLERPFNLWLPWLFSLWSALPEGNISHLERTVSHPEAVPNLSDWFFFVEEKERLCLVWGFFPPSSVNKMNVNGIQCCLDPAFFKIYFVFHKTVSIQVWNDINTNLLASFSNTSSYWKFGQGDYTPFNNKI